MQQRVLPIVKIQPELRFNPLQTIEKRAPVDEQLPRCFHRVEAIVYIRFCGLQIICRMSAVIPRKRKDWPHAEQFRRQIKACTERILQFKHIRKLRDTAEFRRVIQREFRLIQTLRQQCESRECFANPDVQKMLASD